MAKQKTKAGRGRAILMLLLVFGPASLLIMFSLGKCENKFNQLDDFGAIGDYSFIDASGDTWSNKDMEGKIVIFSTIQNTCPRDCAIDIARFNLLIYQKFRKLQRTSSHIKFVSILVDHEGKPVEDLSEVAFMLDDEIQEFNPDVWKIVSGDPAQIYDFTSNGHNLYKAREEKAYKGMPWLESMLLVDKQNHLRSLRSGATEGMLRDLNEHIAILEKEYDKKAAKEKEEKK